MVKRTGGLLLEDEHQLKRAPDIAQCRGKLNKAEIEKLQEVTERYQDDSEWDFCGRTHEFPEWQKNFLPNTSTPIPWEEAMEAQGRADMIDAVDKQDQLERYLDTVFGAWIMEAGDTFYQRIRRGVSLSRQIDLEHIELMEKQELLDWDALGARPGIAITLILSYPYVSDSLKSLPRSTDHDVVLAAVLALLWGTIFFWDTIGRKWPKVRRAIKALLGLMVLSGMAALYGTIVYLILKR
jgi:hypothetical protein